MTKKRVSFSDNLSFFEYDETEDEKLEKIDCIQKIHERIKKRETTICLVFWGIVLSVLIFIILCLCKRIL